MSTDYLPSPPRKKDHSREERRSNSLRLSCRRTRGQTIGDQPCDESSPTSSGVLAKRPPCIVLARLSAAISLTSFLKSRTRMDLRKSEWSNRGSRRKTSPGAAVLFHF